jgi:hypothetical protein
MKVTLWEKVLRIIGAVFSVSVGCGLGVTILKRGWDGIWEAMVIVPFVVSLVGWVFFMVYILLFDKDAI